MELSLLKQITHTTEGYEVKDLVWKPTDNIIRGLVKCPVTGRDSFNNGFVVATWRKNGTLTAKYGGANRTDLYLIIPEMKKPEITEEILVEQEHDLVLYADVAEIQSVSKITPLGVMVQYYEYGNNYKEEFKTYESLTSEQLDKVIIYTHNHS